MASRADRPSLAAALRDARVRPDARGLMSLDEARARVEGTQRYERGQAREVEGTVVLDSDLLWAALLSLKDAHEFVRHARRLEWHFHVRGRDNLAPLERYGIEILPWLAARVDERGTLFDVPWCVLPCLLATRTRAAAELVLRIERVDARLPSERDDPRGAPSPEFRSLDVPRSWLAAHVDPGCLWMAELAADGNERARELLDDLETRAPGLASEVLAAHLSPIEADRRARALGLSIPHLPAAVAELLLESEPVELPAGPVWSVAELDLAADRYEVPDWEHGRQPVAAMRVTGFADPDGDVLVLQALTAFPSAQSPAQRDILAYGPGAPRRHWCDPLVPGADVEAIWMPHYHHFDPVAGGLHLDGEYDAEGVRDPRSARRRIVPRPEGPLPVRLRLGDRVVHVDPFLPRRAVPPPFEEPGHRRLVEPSDVLIAQLADHHRDEVFLNAEELARRIRLPASAVCLFSFDEFEFPSLDELDRFADDLDFVTMVAALRRRRRIGRLPGRPNTDWAHWYPRMVAARERLGEERDLWPWGVDACPPPAPRAELLEAHGGDELRARQAARGAPHLVRLEHRDGPNIVESWAPTLEALGRGEDPRAVEIWPRRLAEVYVRWLARCERWPDPAALRAVLGQTGMVHPAEARAMVARLLEREHLPIECREVALFTLEALVGPDVVVEAALDRLDRMPDAEAIASSVGHIWRRLPERGRPASSSRQAVKGRQELTPGLERLRGSADAPLASRLRAYSETMQPSIQTPVAPDPSVDSK